MIDTSKAKWTLSPQDKEAIQWLEEHEFTGSLEKQYQSKTVFRVKKGEITDNFELPNGVSDLKKYMKQFQKNFDMYCELTRLRKVKKDVHKDR